MKFPSNYDRGDWHSTPKKNDGPVLVEDEGYMSMKDIIAAMMQEGRELVAARSAMHEFQSEEDIDTEAAMDPTRNPGFDMADATQAMAGVQARLKAGVAQAKAQKAAKTPAKSDQPKSEPAKQA